MLNEHKVEHFRTIIGLASDGRVLVEGLDVVRRLCEWLGERKKGAPGADETFPSVAALLIMADHVEILQVPYN